MQSLILLTLVATALAAPASSLGDPKPCCMTGSVFSFNMSLFQGLSHGGKSDTQRVTALVNEDIDEQKAKQVWSFGQTYYYFYKEKKGYTYTPSTDKCETRETDVPTLSVCIAQNATFKGSVNFGLGSQIILGYTWEEPVYSTVFNGTVRTTVSARQCAPLISEDMGKTGNISIAQSIIYSGLQYKVPSDAFTLPKACAAL